MMSKIISRIAACVFTISVMLGTLIVATMVFFLMNGNSFSSFIVTLLFATGIFASAIVLQTAYQKEE